MLYLENELNGGTDAAGDGVRDTGKVLCLAELGRRRLPPALRLGPEQVHVRQHRDHRVEQN